MFSKIHFIKGILKNIFNPRVSFLALVSSNNVIDKKAVVYRFVKIKNARIGRYTYISSHTDVEGAVIGKFCSISDHCRIGMGGHNLRTVSTSPIFTEKNNAIQTQWVDHNSYAPEDKLAVLGNDVWVGSHALINGGVTIGDGAVIGAGAVVIKDVPPYAVVGGVPAKVIKYRFSEDVIERLLKLKWWDFNDEVLINNIEFFQTENISISMIENLKK